MYINRIDLLYLCARYFLNVIGFDACSLMSPFSLFLPPPLSLSLRFARTQSATVTAIHKNASSTRTYTMQPVTVAIVRIVRRTVMDHIVNAAKTTTLCAAMAIALTVNVTQPARHRYSATAKASASAKRV